MEPSQVHISLCEQSEILRDLICLHRPHTEQQSHCRLVTVSGWLHLHSSLCCRAPPVCSGQRVPSMVRREGGVGTVRLFTDGQPKPSCTPRA